MRSRAAPTYNAEIAQIAAAPPHPGQRERKRSDIFTFDQRRNSTIDTTAPPHHSRGRRRYNPLEVLLSDYYLGK